MSNPLTAVRAKLWLVYVDDEDGDDRESWNVFYVTPTVFLHEPTPNELLDLKKDLYDATFTEAEKEEVSFREYAPTKQAHVTVVEDIRP